MSLLWEQNEITYSETYCHNEPRNNSHRPAKPKPKPVNNQKKSAKKRDANLEKIELFACKLCDKKYTSKAGYSRHYANAHESGKDVKVIKKKPATSNVASRALSAWSPITRFRCNHCGKELSSKASLDRHMTSHNRTPKPKARETKKINCTTTNINMINTANYNGFPTPNNFFSAASSSFWN
ncbi:hypothetical protein MSG28_016001 [Choristoneura fumiferana]|uniref:Uncharacterized protein n=2 Tax=Choristoneura fumiferana TaxID=7141 RepID=A0ACC0K568_CHOFU|nr:hypothetical protein MSG28_016001 [Choristoneura fumiferana]